ncbi:head-tail connector protein [Brevundimonas faecalis]|uniref:head-tail connector protein n=1 Tax=Brevundimonas faecalis TaxID=947378 RepID=UPI003620BFF9
MSWLAPVITLAPDAEAIPLAVAKKHVRVLAEDTDEDDYIKDLIDAAVSHIESVIGRFILDRRVERSTDSWSDLAALPMAPIRSLTISVDGVAVDAQVFDLDPDPFHPRAILRPGQSWPSAPAGYSIKVEAEAGFADAIPAELRQAALLLIGQWFRNRTPVAQARFVTELPNGVAALLVNHRRNL